MPWGGDQYLGLFCLCYLVWLAFNIIGFCIGPCFNFKGDMKRYTFCGDIRDCYSGPAFVCMKGFEEFCDTDSLQFTCLDC